MSGMIDGVSKAFLLEHRYGAMRVEGFKDQREMVENMMGWTPSDEQVEDRIAWLLSLKEKIDAKVLYLKQFYEIDGHKLPAEENVDDQ